MMGTMNCVYETPCGWCSKWDKKCDKKIPERGQRAKCNPVDDVMNDSLKEVLVNKMCVEKSDHEVQNLLDSIKVKPPQHLYNNKLWRK